MKPAKTKETVRPRWCDPLCTDPLRHDGKCEIKKLEAGSEVCIECDDVPCSCLPEAASEVLTRNEHSVMVADFHNAFCAGSYDRLVAHDDALRAALKKAEEENELLKWEIQNCRKALDATIVLHSAAEARLSEIVKSLAAAVTKEKP